MMHLKAGLHEGFLIFPGQVDYVAMKLEYSRRHYYPRQERALA